MLAVNKLKELPYERRQTFSKKEIHILRGILSLPLKKYQWRRERVEGGIRPGRH